MRNQILSMLLALGTALSLSGCSTGGDPQALAFAPEESQRLTVYTAHKEEVWWPIVKEFEERTGIWVDVVSGGTNELLERIAQEEDSPKADVMFGGGVESLEFYRDCFQPYTCAESEKLQTQVRVPDDLWTPFSSLPVVLIYNTKLVDPQEITRWGDLLSPEFRGKIAFADPSISGSCFTGLVTLLDALGGDQDGTIRCFVDSLDGRQLDSSGAVLTSVAGGTDWIGVTLEETALKRIAAGDDIALVYPADGTSSVPDGSALVAGAPHEDNAKRFLDFTVSWDVQQLLATQFYRRSVRTDVELGQKLPDLAELSLVDYDVGWASENRNAILMAWAFYLGGEEEP
ncbi:MAG: ABC transporter substrate-binding protein [Lawsonibacter sp.]